MHLYRIECGGEVDYVAAATASEALAHYQIEYELSDGDVEGLVAEFVDDPDAVIVYYYDEVDAETGECRQETATVAMKALNGSAGIICSTAY